jgi:hypothetical protein
MSYAQPKSPNRASQADGRISSQTGRKGGGRSHLAHPLAIQQRWSAGEVTCRNNPIGKLFDNFSTSCA